MLVLSDSTQEGANGEQGITCEKPATTSIDVSQFSEKRLQRGLRDQVRGRDPGEGCEGVEFTADWCEEGTDHGGVEGGEENTNLFLP